MASSQSYLVFYNDGLYQHLDPQTDQLLHESKLNFVPHLSLSSRFPNKAILLGCDPSGHYYCGTILIDEHYHTVVRQIAEQRP